MASQAMSLSLVFLEARRTFSLAVICKMLMGSFPAEKLVVQTMEADELSFQLDRAAWGSPEHMDPAHGC